MLLGNQMSVRCPASGEKLLDGVCFYLEGVPAGTTILGTCGMVDTTSDWSIDFGDGSGVSEFTTSDYKIPEHTYIDEGDYVIQIKCASDAVISGAGTSYYPVIATVAKADNPYVVKVTVGNDMTAFPLSAYSARTPSGRITSFTVNGRWCLFSNLREIVVSKSVVSISSEVAAPFYNLDGFFVDIGNVKNADAVALFAKYEDPFSRLPPNVESVGSFAFLLSNVTNLSGLPRTLTSLGTYAFRQCTYLTDVSDMPSGVKAIGTGTFYSCTALTEARLDNVTSVGSSAFAGCSALTDVYVKGIGHTSATTSASNFFGSATEAATKTLHYVGDVPSYDCKYATYLKHLDISNSSSVGYYAFMNCTGLLDVKVGNIESNGNGPFLSCTALTTVTHNGGVTTGWFGGGTFQNLGITSVTIPDDMKVLRNTANDSVSYNGSFQGCTALSTIDLKNIETLGQSTSNGIFSGCTGLTSVTAPKLKTIVGGQFSGCTSLSSLDMPMLEEAGVSAFSGCSLVDSIPPSCKSFGAGSFRDTGVSLDTLTIQEDGYCGAYAFKGCNIGTITDNRRELHGGTSYYSMGLYSDISGLTEISFPNLEEVEGAELSALARCSRTIRHIRLPNLKRIYGCYSMLGMTFTQTMGTTLTDDCELESLEFPSLETIGYTKSGSVYNKNTYWNFSSVVSGCQKVQEIRFPSLMKVYNNKSSGSTSGYGVFTRISHESPSFLKRLYFPVLNSLLGNCIPSLFSENSVLEEIHFGVENKAYFTSHANWSTLFGLGSSWSGKIYFDLNADGTTATNSDGSAIEPEYDGSQS